MLDTQSNSSLAKSRLKKPLIADSVAENKQLTPHKNFLEAYKSKLSTLFIGFFFLLLLLVFLNTIKPNQIENFLFSNSFLPFLTLSGLSIFFITSFILLNSRRGLFISVGSVVFLWIKLTNPDTSLLLLGLGMLLIAWFSIFEFILIQIKRKQSHLN